MAKKLNANVKSALEERVRAKLSATPEASR
jgi:hypothetical protein